MNDKPYTYENSSNPWLMDPKGKKTIDNIIIIDNQKITAEYQWRLNAKQREELLYKVFNYYRKNGFPYELLTKDYMELEFDKLCKYDVSNILTKDGYISNSGSLCLDVCRHFSFNLFYKARGDKKSKSMEDIFNDDEQFIKVLKNRMGWNITTEDGNERPYIFAISDKQILNGIKNSGLGYGVSNFRPTIAKFIFQKYLGNRVNPFIYDYSAGWGARAIAALSLGYSYIATDPLTSNCVNNLISFFSKDIEKNKCYNVGSEKSLSDIIPNNTIDMCFSCPPYFTLERYSDDNEQCYNKNKNFNDWIDDYWRNTVKNCYKYLKKDGYFGLVIKDYYEKFPLKEEMNKILEEEGFILKDIYQYKTTRNHLSGKKKSGNVSKNNEYILIYGICK